MSFWPILFLIAYIRLLEIVLAKKTTDLVLLFHKNITKLVFLWPNMSQKSFKVLNISKPQYKKKQNNLYSIYQKLNTLKHFWFILGKRKTSLVIFIWKRRTSSVVFLANIISNGLYQAIRFNIVAKMTTELVLLFHEKTTKLVFLKPNMGQLCFKMLKFNYLTIERLQVY